MAKAKGNKVQVWATRACTHLLVATTCPHSTDNKGHHMDKAQITTTAEETEKDLMAAFRPITVKIG